MIKKISVILLATASVFVSCDSRKEAIIKKDKEPIVSVNGKVLYRGDLNNSIPEGLSGEDSIKSAESYIKLWIYDELIYEKAKRNVADQDRINELVENYRQSLTIFTYLEELLKKELSKNITDKDLKNFYEKHPDKFKLESSIIKGLFLKIPKSSPELANMRKWYKSNSESAKDNIQKESIQNTVIFDYFYDNWVSIDDVISNIPVPGGDKAQFVKVNKNFDTQDSSYVYLLHIEDYILKGDKAPFDYAKPKISEIMLNKLREKFLKQFEDDLYKKAERDGDIKYYTENE